MCSIFSIFMLFCFSFSLVWTGAVHARVGMDSGITCVLKGHLTVMFNIHVKDLVFEIDVAEFTLTNLRTK